MKWTRWDKDDNSNNNKNTNWVSGYKKRIEKCAPNGRKKKRKNCWIINGGQITLITFKSGSRVMLLRVGGDGTLCHGLNIGAFLPIILSMPLRWRFSFIVNGQSNWNVAISIFNCHGPWRHTDFPQCHSKMNSNNNVRVCHVTSWHGKVNLNNFAIQQ